MVKAVRITYFALLVLLSCIYWYECERAYKKFRFLSGSESFSQRTYDPIIKTQRLEDRRNENIKIYLLVLIPALILAIWYYKKPSRILLIIFFGATALATALLLLYLYRKY